jgi:nicotinamide mononucleotide transporter
VPDLERLLAEVAALWPWEALAVALAIAYLALAIRESTWCWPAGIASSAIYGALFFGATLYMEAVLQLFYIAISVYGWRRWSTPGSDFGRNRVAEAARDSSRSRGEESEVGDKVAIVTWSAGQHVAALATIGALATANGLLLDAFTPAALPYLDALVAWSSVVTTWMVARKVLENWLYWFVIDALCVWIYARRGLWLTAGLFVAYLAMIVVGYRAWRARLAVAAA